MSGYTLKRNLAYSSGFLSWKWKHIPNGLYVFNFHRIGDAADTPFDPNIFSGTEEQFRKQAENISKRFRVISIPELLNIMESGSGFEEPLAIISFDDGYIDNYTNAFPILQKLGIPGVFFIATDFTEGKEIPWWEQVAWIVRHSRNEDIRLDGCDATIRIDQSNLKLNIRQVLRYFKDNASISLNKKLSNLKTACAVDFENEGSETLFMSWSQIRELRNTGMDIGSHTCSHGILSHLSSDEQQRELSHSKKLIEENLGEEIPALAYPVGGLESFTQTTKDIAARCGYKLAFSFPKGGGFSKSSLTDAFAIPRMGLEPEFGLVDIQYRVVSVPAL